MLAVAREQRVHHRERPSPHGGDVGKVDHDAAPAGEIRLAHNEGGQEALDGEQQPAVAVRDRGAIVADAHGAAGQSQRFDDGSDVLLVQQADASRVARWQGPPNSCGDPAVRAHEAERVASMREIFGKVGLHEMVRTAVQRERVERLPVQALEEFDVLCLHVREEPLAAACGRGADGEPHKLGTDTADTPEMPVHAEAGTPPQAGLRLVDAHHADHCIGGTRDAAQRHQRNGDLIDAIMVVVL